MTASTNPAYHKAEVALRASPRKWLVTGAAGFIGSHLCEELLKLGQSVVGLDNFLTGSPANLDAVRSQVGETLARSFHFIEGDIRSIDVCRKAMSNVDIVLHQAALGSVSRSIEDPIATHQNNVDGTLNLLVTARDRGLVRFVFASSSSVYGDHPDLPKMESRTGRPLSPYAISKKSCELYASVFRQLHGLQIVGLRYFNVFGPRQRADSAYAAVIPRWISELLNGKPVSIFGDGKTSRDFTYISNVVQANILAATTEIAGNGPEVFNIAAGSQTTLNELLVQIKDAVKEAKGSVSDREPIYHDFRKGDIAHSHAAIDLARNTLGYCPTVSVRTGLTHTVKWFSQVPQ